MRLVILLNLHLLRWFYRLAGCHKPASARQVDHHGRDRQLGQLRLRVGYSDRLGFGDLPAQDAGLVLGCLWLGSLWLLLHCQFLLLELDA